MATSSCKNVTPVRQSDFSIQHILTRAGERFEKRRKIDQCHSCSASSGGGSSSPDSDDHSEVEIESPFRDDGGGTEGGDDEAEECDVDRSQREDASVRTFIPSVPGCGGGGAPTFDWLYYTRYHPPKLPRPPKSGPVKRTPGRLPRVPFTPAQLSALEDAYKVSTYLSSEEANQLAYSLELTNTRVKIWFQNRRARDRREKRETSLASGHTVPAGPIPLVHYGGHPSGVGHHVSSPSSVEESNGRRSRSPIADRRF